MWAGLILGRAYNQNIFSLADRWAITGGAYKQMAGGGGGGEAYKRQLTVSELLYLSLRAIKALYSYKTAKYERGEGIL